jgi:hypothetical protein
MDIDSRQEMEYELLPVSINLFEQMFLGDNDMHFKHVDNSKYSHSPLPITQILESGPGANLCTQKLLSHGKNPERYHDIS